MESGFEFVVLFVQFFRSHLGILCHGNGDKQTPNMSDYGEKSISMRKLLRVQEKWYNATYEECIYVRTTCAFFLSADDVFETVSDRELRQIFEGQNRIHLEIKQLNRQLDMILDEQRRYVSAVTDEIAKRGTGFPGQQGQVNKWKKNKTVIDSSA